jgi:putative oxidoreductase
MKKFFFDCGTRDATASLGILGLRTLIGLMMLIGHGIPKFQGYSAMKDSFYVPEIFPLNFLSPPLSLMACIGAEMVAAALIILGFATRPAAFILGFCMVVAAFGVMGGAPWFQASATPVPTKEMAILYLIPMLALILSGGGSFSLDAALHKDNKRRRW